MGRGTGVYGGVCTYVVKSKVMVWKRARSPSPQHLGYIGYITLSGAVIINMQDISKVGVWG